MATKIQTAGGVITVDSKVEVNEKAISDAIRAITQNSMKHIMQTVANKIVARTLPNNPQSGKSPTKKGVNNLRRRIKENIANSDFLQAFPNNEGKPIWSKVEGHTAIPAIVVKKYRGRPSKGRKINQPDRIYSADELVKHIRDNTKMVRKKGAAMRVRNGKSKFVWTTKAHLQAAMRKFQARAGNTIFGWSPLAELVGSAAMRKSLNDGNFDKPGGAAKYTPAEFRSIDEIRLSAVDANAPKEIVNYNQRCIDSMMPQWVNSAIRSELKFISTAKLLRGLKVPPDVKISIE